jgi:hypothetical protein
MGEVMFMNYGDQKFLVYGYHQGVQKQNCLIMFLIIAIKEFNYAFKGIKIDYGMAYRSVRPTGEKSLVDDTASASAYCL